MGLPTQETPVLRVLHPPGYLPERRYVFDVLFREFLGLDYTSAVHGRDEVWITAADNPAGRTLALPDVLFQTPESQWLRPTSLPRRPVRWWTVPSELAHACLLTPEVPVLYGAGGNVGRFEAAENRIALGWDLFGGAMFMLTRYEEMVLPDREAHGRFPAGASLACREGFSDRPIVNEYLELLWAAMRRLWPGLKRRERTYRLLPSHDVDWPLCTAGRNVAQVLKAMAGDMLKRSEGSLALGRLRSYLRTRRGWLDEDFGNTFPRIMESSEKRGLTSAFYFIAARTAGAVDGDYSLGDPWIRRLLRTIHRRGHEVGLHPSYGSFQSPAQTRRESDRLRRVCKEEGIGQDSWGGRQHFLRWTNPVTWQNWADAGLDYDATLGFADRVGFRCGTCYEYPAYNLAARSVLPLRERPLIVMDQALQAPHRLSREAAYARVVGLAAACRRFHGDFSILWHNSTLSSRQERLWYERILDRAA